MIEVVARLTGDVTSGLDKLKQKIKSEVLLSGVAAMAKVVYEEARLNAGRHKKTGALQDAVYRVYAEDESTEERKVYKVSWNRAKAPHGHLIEWGTSKMAARPFLRPALSRMDDAVKAGTNRMKERMSEGT